ncbi:MAG: type II secretion system protein [Phycisphaeraceae bacterium]|nr:type II secretion system protein [Phycisphaeraceae bacterium]
MTPTGRQLGVTLLETLMAIVVLAVVGATVVPLIGSSVDVYASASDAREISDRAAFAMERCVRLLREAPGEIDTGDLDITVAEPSRVEFGDGRGLSLDGEVLLMHVDADVTAPLCRDVSSFTIQYLGSDGLTDTLDTPGLTDRFVVSITTSSLTLSGAAFCRLHMVRP